MRILAAMTLFTWMGCTKAEVLPACTTSEDCFEGYVCIPSEGSSICASACQNDDDCIVSQRCEIPVGASQGGCVAADGDEDGGDPTDGGGD